MMVRLVGGEAGGGLVAQLAMRPVMVVIAAEVLNDNPGFGQRPELLPVEALVTEAAMEALDEPILPGAGRLDVDRLDQVLG